MSYGPNEALVSLSELHASYLTETLSCKGFSYNAPPSWQVTALFGGYIPVLSGLFPDVGSSRPGTVQATNTYSSFYPITGGGSMTIDENYLVTHYRRYGTFMTEGTQKLVLDGE